MSDSTLTAGILADLEALSRLEERFFELHGEEARRRWGSIGASETASFAGTQAEAIRDLGPVPEVWETLAWELSERVLILEQLRSRFRKEAEG